MLKEHSRDSASMGTGIALRAGGAVARTKSWLLSLPLPPEVADTFEKALVDVGLRNHCGLSS